MHLLFDFDGTLVNSFYFLSSISAKSNDNCLDAHAFWGIYTTLIDLEAAFRSLKTELGFRPVYHQKETRIDGL